MDDLCRRVLTSPPLSFMNVGAFLVRLLPEHSWLLENLTEFPLLGGTVNYTCSPLSLVVIGIGTWILLRGAKNSSLFNNLMTIANITVLLFVVMAGIISDSINPENFIPFVPNGLPSVLQGGGLVYVFIVNLYDFLFRSSSSLYVLLTGSFWYRFFAYLGFDQVGYRIHGPFSSWIKVASTPLSYHILPCRLLVFQVCSDVCAAYTTASGRVSVLVLTPHLQPSFFHRGSHQSREEYADWHYGIIDHFNNVIRLRFPCSRRDGIVSISG